MVSMPKLPALPALGAGTMRLIALSVVGLLVIAAAVFLLRPGSDDKVLTASFPRTVSIYEGSAVRVLGVPVGEVVSVEPAGTTVEVEMRYDSEIDVPADASAVVIAPSVVGDRYIQLTPVYEGGPKLEDGARLSTDRTAVPLELDDIYQNLDDLAVGLGPDGANKEGALTRLLRTTSRNFGGQGQKVNETIENLSRFTSTLDNNKDALFSTAAEIERFVSALRENDQTVRDFNDSLAGASDVLADERQDLAAALRNLGIAMKQVRGFVQENKQALSSNIKGLVSVTDILVKQRAALDETLDAAPIALSNLFHTYNPSTGTLDTRSNFGENIDSAERDPANTLCSLVTTADPNGDLCDQLVNVLGRTAPGRRSSHRPVVVEPIDRSLGGLVEVDR